MAHLLTGKLFDQTGEPLYLTSTSKGGRRYRYYVSRRLVTVPAKQTKAGWRLPAPAVERAVVAAAVQMLEDRAALGTLLHETAGMPAHSLAGALEALDDCRLRLQAESVSAPAAGPLIVRVELGEHALQLTLNLAVLLGDQIEPVTRGALSIRRSVPMRLRRRGVESRIILGGASC